MMGCVPFTLDRLEVWRALAFAPRIEHDPPIIPTASILLGSGTDVGLFTGIVVDGGRIAPVNALHIVGAGMPRLSATDFAADPSWSPSPTPANAERWSRLIGALGGANVWGRLTGLHHAIVGLGRIGSLVAQTLARQGTNRLTLIDPDVIERHNLDAMDLVTERDIGRFKVDAVADRLRADHPRLKITALAVSVLDEIARQALKCADVLIGCVDSDEA